MDATSFISTTSANSTLMGSSNVSQGRAEFAGRLAKAMERSQENTETKGETEIDRKEQQARDASEQLVASTFLLPLLDQLEDSPFKTDIFHGGMGEDIFKQQLNTMISDRIASTPNFPLVDTVTSHILGKQPELPLHSFDLDRHA